MASLSAMEGRNVPSLDTFSISSLGELCLKNIIDQSIYNLQSISSLPANLKDKLLHIVSKRGLVTDQNIRLMIHKRTKVIDFSESNITDESLFVLGMCEHLKKFNIDSAKGSCISVSEEGLKAVAKSSRFLKIVHLRRCLTVTDEAIINFSKQCPQLFELNIAGCHLISDIALKALGDNCHCLQRINFSKTKVSDKGVLNLVSGFPSRTLDEIHMDGCKRLTDRAVEAVISYCPNIQIIIFHNCPRISEQSRVMMEEFTGPNSKIRQLTWTIY